ncbi:carbohydrate-binding family 9-like protein [Bacteroidota bacterium]
MLNKLIIVVCITLCSGFLPDSPEFTVISRFAGTEIRIDGDLGESAWQLAQKLPLSNNLDGTAITETTISSYAMTCYDKDNLYIAFVNHDHQIFSNYSQRDEFLWNEEVVEIFIDTDEVPSTYIELQVSPKNVVFDSFITDTANIDLIVTPRFDLEGWRHAVSVHGTVNNNSDHDSLWTVEMAVPFTSLKSDFDIEQITEYNWRINFYRLDRDDLGPTDYAWSPTYRRFHTPSKFGTIIFR